MKAIKLLILYVAIGVAVAWGVHTVRSMPDIIVVHTGESKTLHYNPATHEEVRNEMADGNVMLTVKPKESGK